MSRDDLKKAIERTHGGTATFRETVRTTDTFRGEIAWDGNVSVFDLADNPFAEEAYAWSEGEGKIVAVLKTPPVDGLTLLFQEYGSCR